MVDVAKYNNYYSDARVLFEMIKEMRGKETVFLGGGRVVRCIKAHSVKYFMKNIRAFSVFKLWFPNFYISTANYYNMPVFSFNPNRRRMEQEIFNKTFRQFLVNYDYFIDVDNKGDFSKTLIETTFIKNFFDKIEAPYSLRFSGSGFHFLIKGYYFNFITQKDFKNQKANEFYKWVTENLVSMFGLKCVDVQLYGARQIYKIPYSLDIKTHNICYPLDDEEFKNFEYSMVKPENVLKKDITSLGIKEREGNMKVLKELWNSFVEENERVSKTTVKE